VQAKRTGISDASQGLDPNILQNVTATAVAAFQNASSGKLELIARIFAETGIKSLFKGILHLLCKYSDKPRLIRMRGKYVPMDPRMWSNQYDVQIAVGLGTGSQQQQMAMLSMILSKQEQILQQFGPANPLVSVSQYRETLGRMIEAAGFKDSAMFFKTITPEIDAQLSQPQEPGQDPAMQAMMAQAQMQMQIAQQKAQADIQLAREKAAAQLQLEREKAAAELQRKQQEFEAEVQLKAAKVGAGITSNIQIPG
jgi:Skp family chaperone for outer membrane proteins